MRLDIPDNFDVDPLMRALQRAAEAQHHRLVITFDHIAREGVLAIAPQWMCSNHPQLPLSPNVIPITQARAARGSRRSPRAPHAA